MSNKQSFYSNCGCLQSESTAALKKFTKNSPQELQTNNHNNSQTCLQNLSKVDSLKQMFISNESIHVVKLNTLRKRMIASLNGIQSLLGDRPQPDGVEDLKRRQQRAAEFSSRFCRNYMYPLQRQMNIITKMWKTQSLNHTYSAYFSLCQEVIATHQNAHLALQAYFHQMPCSVEKGVPDKLEELLQVVNSLCSLCSKLDMSEGDSDFNSKRVKQHCEQLMLQIKAEVIDEEGESCAAVSHSCAQKETISASKKDPNSHRFSMYSRNLLHKSSNNQNKKSVKMSMASKKQPVKLHCNRQTVKEANTSTPCKPKNVHEKPSAHKTYEKGVEEDSDIGEVCASDDVKTMMEFFLAEEIPAQCDTALKRVYPKKNTSSFLNEFDKQSLPSMNTLKKLEGEIKNLKKQTKSLKEMGHPNYSVYIKALETMSLQLSGMKSRRHISNTASVQITKQGKQQTVIKQHKEMKQMVNERQDTEFPKNVKLICLSSEADNELLDTTQNYHVTTRSPGYNIRKIDTVQQKDDSLRPIVWQAKESVKIEACKNSVIQMNNDWKPQDIGKLHEVNHNTVSEFLPALTETQSTWDNSVGVQHPNTPETVYSNSRILDYSKLTETKTTGVMLTIPQHDISSVIAYHQMFQEYTSSSSLYKESLRPWLMVERLANHLLDSTLEEITLNDTGIQKITSGLLQLEFQ